MPLGGLLPYGDEQGPVQEGVMTRRLMPGSADAVFQDLFGRPTGTSDSSLQPAPDGNMAARFASAAVSQPPIHQPLDLGSLGSPQSPAAPSSAQSPGELAQQFGPVLALLLPILAKNGGRDGIASFMRGLQRGQETRRQRAIQDEDRGMRLDEHEQRKQDYQRRLAQDADLRRRDAHTWLTTMLPEQIRNVQTPEELAALQRESRDFARTYFRLDPSSVDALFGAGDGQQGVSTMQRNQARARIAGLRREHGADWAEFGEQFMYDMPNGDRVSFDELLARSGMARDPGYEPPEPRPENLTEFESYFQLEYLPAIREERELAGNTAPLTQREIRRHKLAARQEWAAQARAPQRPRATSGARPETPAQTRAAKNDQLRKLESELMAVLAPDSGLSGAEVEAERSRIHGEISALQAGISARAVERRVRAALRDERMRVASGLKAAGSETVMDMAGDPAATADRRLDAAEEFIRSGGSVPGPEDVTRAELEAIAQANGWTYEEAKRQAEARGRRVIEQ